MEVLEGDARETLKTIDTPVDFIFLDGWKGMYLPVYRVLRDRFSPDVMIVADNINHPAAADYLAEVRSKGSGFISLTLGKQEISLHL